MDIIKQLTRIYEEEETWHRTKLSQEEAEKYYEEILKRGNIIYHTDKGSVVGYIEWFCVSVSQLTRSKLARHAACSCLKTLASFNKASHASPPSNAEGSSCNSFTTISRFISFKKKIEEPIFIIGNSSRQ